MPPKLEKGILGVKKDPKTQMLFSFNARGKDMWPSDDSEDSSYCPSDGAGDTAGVSRLVLVKSSWIFLKIVFYFWKMGTIRTLQWYFSVVRGTQKECLVDKPFTYIYTFI